MITKSDVVNTESMLNGPMILGARRFMLFLMTENNIDCTMEEADNLIDKWVGQL